MPDKKKSTAKLPTPGRNTVESILYGFGFREITLKHDKESTALANKIFTQEKSGLPKTEALPLLEHCLNVLKYAEAHGTQGAQPLLSYTKEHRAQKKETVYRVDVLGLPRGIAEALVIAAGTLIVEEMNLTECIWKMACVGEKESFQKFTREITAYFKKHINDLPAPIREKFKDSPLSLLSISHPSLDKIIEEAPKGINYLSESSRNYFKELLEYLEAIGCVYEIDNCRLPHFDHEGFAMVNFSCSENDKFPITASGARYTNLSKIAGLRREMPAFGIEFVIADKILGPSKKIKASKEPTYYLVHTGANARQQALKVLMDLVRNGIHIEHGILKDKLGSQMVAAEQLQSHYILLIGQKEYVENAVIVRNTVNRSEKSVKAPELPKYLKSL